MEKQKIPSPQALDLRQTFPPATAEQWQEIARQALRGAPLEQLRSTTLEGLELEPLYGPQHLEALSHLDGAPGRAPYVRGATADGCSRVGWELRADLALPTAARFREAAQKELEVDTVGLGIVLDAAARAGLDPDQDAAEGLVGLGGLQLACWPDLSLALEGVDLTQVPLALRAGASALPAAALLCVAAQRRKVALDALRGSLELDPLGLLAAEGTLPTALETLYDELADLAAWCNLEIPELTAVRVSACAYHDGGGNAVHELGFAMATAIAYMEALTDRGLDPDDAAAELSFSFAVGTRLLTEVAKLRAARLLWSQVAESFGCSEDARVMKLHVRTSRWNKATRDGYNNLLRGTLEAFAAAIGGARSISVAPYDQPWSAGGWTSRRLARNIQILLREETDLGRVLDPAGGTYVIESLTERLAARGWALMQQVERQGGMAAAMEQGFPQQQVQQLADDRAQKIANGSEPLVGVNRYAAAGEQLPEPMQEDLAGARAKRAAAISGIRQGRDRQLLARRTEQLQAALDGAPGSRMQAALEGAAAGMTLGELCAALRHRSGPPPTVPRLPSESAERLFDAAQGGDA